MDQKQWTPDHIRRIMTDPGYCLSVPPVIPEDDKNRGLKQGPPHRRDRGRGIRAGQLGGT
jgi:hypothetical protein